MVRLHPISNRPRHLRIEIDGTSVGTAILNPSGAYTCRFNRRYFTHTLTYERVLNDDELRAFCAAHCKLFAKSTANV